jgi:hypothetical protein
MTIMTRSLPAMLLAVTIAGCGAPPPSGEDPSSISHPSSTIIFNPINCDWGAPVDPNLLPWWEAGWPVRSFWINSAGTLREGIPVAVPVQFSNDTTLVFGVDRTFDQIDWWFTAPSDQLKNYPSLSKMAGSCQPVPPKGLPIIDQATLDHVPKPTPVVCDPNNPAPQPNGRPVIHAECTGGGYVDCDLARAAISVGRKREAYCKYAD